MGVQLASHVLFLRSPRRVFDFFFLNLFGGRFKSFNVATRRNSEFCVVRASFLVPWWTRACEFLIVWNTIDIFWLLTKISV